MQALCCSSLAQAKATTTIMCMPPRPLSWQQILLKEKAHPEEPLQEEERMHKDLHEEQQAQGVQQCHQAALAQSQAVARAMT